MEPSRKPTAKSSPRLTVKVIVIGIASGAIGIGAILSLGVRPIVNRRILPQVDAALENALSTEVELGSVRTLLPWQVSLGASEISGLATVDGIDIRANPISLLFRRPVAIQIVLHQPDVTLAQSEDGTWQLPELQLESNGEPPPITLGAAELIVRRGNVRVQPSNGNSIELLDIFADARWTADDETFEFDVRTDYDSGSLKIEGEALLSSLTIQAEAVAASVPVNALTSILPQLPLQADGGTIDADLQLAWQLDSAPDIEGTLVLDNLSASLERGGSVQAISELDGHFSFRNQTIQIDKFEGSLGEIPFTSEGTVNWSDLLDWDQLKLPIPPSSESVSWLGDDYLPELSDFGLQIAGTTVGFYQPISSTSTSIQDLDPQRSLVVQQQTEGEPGIDVTISVPRATFNELLDVAQIELPVPVEGAVRSTVQITGTVTNPIAEGRFDSLETGLIDRIELPSYAGRFQFENSQLTLSELDVNFADSGQPLGALSGNGNLSLGDVLVGNVQINLADTNPDALLSLYDITDLPVVLGSTDLSLSANLIGDRVNANVDWGGEGGSFPWGGNAELLLEDGAVFIPNAQLQVEDGTVDATLTSSAPNTVGVRTIEATIIPQNLPLSLVAPQLSGVLNGDINLQASSDSLNLEGLRGQGSVELLQVADLGDFVADLAWDGSGLTVSNGLALDAIAVNGQIPVNSESFAIGPANIALSANNLLLEDLPLLAGQPVAGAISFQGTLSGMLDNLQLNANASATSLEVAALVFEPLQGPVNWQANNGLSLELLGSGSGDGTGADRIILSTGPDFLPTSVDIQQGITIINGDRQNELLNLQVVQLPLSLLNGVMPGYFGGTLDSSLAVNLQDRVVDGEFVAFQPHWAGLKVTRLQSDFRFEDNTVSITDGQLDLEGSTIEANGSVTLPNSSVSRMRGGRLVRNQPSPGEVDLFISTENGKLENVLAGFDWDEWSDVMQSFQVAELGTAADLQTTPILAFQRSLYEQVFAYVEVVEQLNVGLTDDRRIPDLSDLKGDFQGDVRVVGLLNNPIAQIDFQGSNWSLEEFLIENLELSGLFKDLQLSLSTLIAETGDRSAQASGKFGYDQIDGSIRVNDFPVGIVQRFVPSLPSFSGDLSLTTDLAGSLNEPRIDGEIRLNDAMLNERPLYALWGDFDYNNSILDVEGNLAVESINIDDPATLAGTIPYQLPFVSIEPESDRFWIKVEARDEELSLVNSLTDEIGLQDPNGLLSVELTGALDNTSISDLTLDGIFELSDTSLEINALPEPINNLNTTVHFNFDAIHVDNFAANFIGSELQASGFLPLERTVLKEGETPIEITIAPTQVQFSNLYDGNLSGDIFVSGNVLAPIISGDISVWEGFVNIAPTEVEASVSVGVGAYQPPSPPLIQPEFNEFKLNLGQSLDIGWEPLFRFTATGTLALYGPVSSPEGQGTVTLTRGAITAGPAYLRLDRSWANVAEFNRENGIDPYLNVRVTTTATEVNRPSSSGATNEVARFTGQNGQGSDLNSRNSGEARSIEVRATVQGQASELNSGLNSPALVFSSVPGRTQNEIINLLGSDILNNLATNIFQSTVAGSLYGSENSIGDSVGLDEVRIGTFVGENNETSIGLELAKDLGRNISITAETSLTSEEEDPLLGARYRINDSLILRGRSDFNQDTRGGIEFETRF
ncbi:MAG: translocation/assembly module TamB domain-containing protein [Synechococcus sp.]